MAIRHYGYCKYIRKDDRDLDIVSILEHELKL